MYYLGVMLFTLACNNSEEKQPDSATQSSVAPIPITPKPKPTCIKLVRNAEMHTVAIYCDNNDDGAGGIYRENGKWYLITASHLFPKGKAAYYSTTLGKDTLYVVKTTFNKDDAVIMELSSRKKQFEGFSTYKNDGSQKSGWTTQMLSRKVGGEKIFSLCGDEYAHIGYLVNEPDFVYAGLIVKKHSVPGESGTVFYDERGNLYVMSQQYVADDNEGYQINGIKKDEQVSLLRPIGFGIQISETGAKTFVSW